MYKGSSRITRRDALRLGGAAGAGAFVATAGCLGDAVPGGSGGGESDEPVTEERVGTGDQELTHWLLPDASHAQDDNPALAKVYERLFRTWAKNHSEFSINLEYQTNLEQMKTKLLQSAARGNAPSMAQVDSFWVPNFTQHLRPVTDAVDDPDDWYSFVKDIVVRDGEWLAVWKNTDCRALFYRQDLIDEYNDGEPPRTWDELIRVGSDVKENEDMAGYMYNGGKWEATTFDNLAMYWAQGGDLVTDDGAPALRENRDALLSVFEFFERTIDSGVTPKRVANINDYALLRQAALNGETAMFLGGNWQIATIKEQAGSESEWKRWNVAEIPQRSADTASTGTGGWTVGVFEQDDALRSAATDYARLFTDTKNMGEFCEAGAYLPTRKSVFEDVPFFSEDPYMQTFQTLLENGRARPGVPIYLTISSEWQTAAEKVITGQATPAEAVDTMIENVNAQAEE
ncbi:extracellular solute-binding protein [Halegenticoccus tardaugens]|uniref:extracellular solute-binding protein n=1 Tax=Halegenticoccus tardaugens TaxID=2071624 RepID=UPI00100C1A73|nr:extracellular solute-binding protein [Halegenticoccus tardaugens]